MLLHTHSSGVRLLTSRTQACLYSVLSHTPSTAEVQIQAQKAAFAAKLQQVLLFQQA